MTYQRTSLNLHSLVPDLIPQDAPVDAWNAGNNVVFRNKESARVFGDSPTLPGAAIDARTCVFLTVQGTGYWVYATPGGVYAHDGSTQIDITPTGWALPDTPETVWSSCVLNGIAFINASDRDPVFWSGDVLEACQPLPDWFTDGRCLTLRAHKNFLFAIGMISEGAQRVRWSDAAEAGTVPQFWSPAPDNLAGFVDLAPLSSPCVEGATLRDSFVVYKQESIWSFDFVGGNAVFAIRMMFAEHGIAGPNALTMGMDDVHLYVGNEGDVFIHDGVRVQSVLDGRAQRDFYGDFSANANRVFSAATLAREKLGIIIYPRAGSTKGDRALLFDFVNGDIGFRDMPDVLCAGEGGALRDVGDQNSWDGSPTAWDEDNNAWTAEIFGQTLDDVLVGGGFGFALISDPGARDFITGPVAARLEKSGLSFGDPQRRKMIGRVWPKVTGRAGDVLKVRLGGQDITGGPVSLNQPVDFTIGQTTSIDAFIQGRYLSIDISSEGGAPWRMGSLDVEFREVGGF